MKCRLMDPDEQVRIAATAALCDVAQCHPADLSVETLEAMASRTTDKKLCVRHQAVQALCTLHEVYQAMPEQNRRKFATRFSWMPTRVIGSYGLGSSPKDIYLGQLSIEQAVEESLLPRVQVFIASIELML